MERVAQRVKQLDLEKRLASTMNESRITLISDPTDEFPDNKNNNFRVRLPTILNLPGDTCKRVYGGYRVNEISLYFNLTLSSSG